MTEASSEIAAAFAETLVKTARKLRTRFDARVVARGLTYPRARALMALSRQAMTQRELADELELEGPTVVRLLDGMEALGLLRRTAVEGDRRLKRIELTREGAHAAATVTGIGKELGAVALEGVPAEHLETALQVLLQVSQALDRDRGHAG